MRVKDVVDVLQEYETPLVEAAAETLPDALSPDDDVVDLETLADRHGVSEDALETISFPDHVRVGRTLVRPAVLDRLESVVEVGMSLSTVESRLAEHGIDDVSATLSWLGYRVEWEGLGGGTVRERE